MLKRMTVCAVLLSGPALAQGAQVLSEKNISFGLAKEIAETALAACQADGAKVTVTVLDRNGTVRVTYRDDGSAPHAPKTVSARPMQPSPSKPLPRPSPSDSTRRRARWRRCTSPA